MWLSDVSLLKGPPYHVVCVYIYICVCVYICIWYTGLEKVQVMFEEGLYVDPHKGEDFLLKFNEPHISHYLLFESDCN